MIGRDRPYILNHGLLAASSGCLASGIFFPMITFEQFWIFEDTYSLLMGTLNLLKSGKYFLFLIIFCFSIIFPITKIFILYRVHLSQASSEKKERQLKFLSIFGKWSMLDVFVVAVLVMTVQVGGTGSVQTHIGLYSFSLAVVLSMVATFSVRQAARRRCD